GYKGRYHRESSCRVTTPFATASVPMKISPMARYWPSAPTSPRNGIPAGKVRVATCWNTVSPKSGHCAAARQRAAERQFVGKLQVAAHRQARRDACHGEAGDVAQH